MKYYLRILKDNMTFGFAVEGINQIFDTDIPVSDEDYESFFEQQAQGEQFRLKEELPETGSLFDYVEAYTPEPLPTYDAVFSVCSDTDILTKAKGNIVFNAKNAVGGGV